MTQWGVTTSETAGRAQSRFAGVSSSAVPVFLQEAEGRQSSNPQVTSPVAKAAHYPEREKIDGETAPDDLANQVASFKHLRSFRGSGSH